MTIKKEELKITVIAVSQLEELVNLSRAIYKEYYLHLWNSGGANWYMYEYAYDSGKIKEELSDKNNLHFILYDDEKPMGYLKIRIDAQLEGYETQDALEIERIYLYKSISGKGFGKKLMLLSEEIAREHQKQIIFLKAMDTSYKAIVFYQSCGFSICGKLRLPFPQMKEEYRGMIILKKILTY